MKSLSGWMVLAAVSGLALAGWANQAASREAERSSEAERLLDQMLQQPDERDLALPPLSGERERDATTGAAAVAPGAAALPLIREGTDLVDRLGRLTRNREGQMEFTFEADGRAMRDPPMILLPNLTLMSMENAVAASNRDLRFRITGTVTEYRGRNYLLLHKAVVAPD